MEKHPGDLANKRGEKVWDHKQTRNVKYLYFKLLASRLGIYLQIAEQY